MHSPRRIGIIVVGYVGKSIIDCLLRVQSYDIIGYDVSEERVSHLQAEYKHNNGVFFTKSLDDLTNCDCYLICVPTNVQKRVPDLSNLLSAKNSLEKVVTPGSTIIVESSVYVGATRKIFGDLREKGIYIGFSPERVDPGRKAPLSHDIPKIISGIDEVSLEMVRGYYEPVFTTLVEVSSLETAEVCKLYENCFRVVNIAFVNEIADFCEQRGINAKEVVSASSTKPFGFMPFQPGLGMGGHCLPNNPYYLMKGEEASFPLLKQSIQEMEVRPYLKGDHLMRNYKFDSVLIVGLGFEKGESLLTNSPGLRLANYLKKCGKQVSLYDPLGMKQSQNDESIGKFRLLKAREFNATTLGNNDLVVIAMDQIGVDENLLMQYENLYQRKVVRF